MAGRRYTSWELNSYRGSNSVIGTNDDDIITIQHRMFVPYGIRNSNTIDLLDGRDNVQIGWKMEANGRGSNTILGASGDKNINIAWGLDAKYGGHNNIILESQIPGFVKFHRNLTLGGAYAVLDGRNTISLKSASGSEDNVSFTKNVWAYHDGRNDISTGDGSLNLSFKNHVSAGYGGQNNIAMGVGSQNIKIGWNLETAHGGTNKISSQDGSITKIDVNWSMMSHGQNTISLGETSGQAGQHAITIGHNLISWYGGKNQITSDGAAHVKINGYVTSYTLNEITTGSGNDTISIGKGMYAFGGTNLISTGAGDDAVHISGHVTATITGSNIVNTGEGNDVIHLDNAYVHFSRDLTIDAGDGWDRLRLSADNDIKFKINYQAWLTEMAKTSTLSGTGIEEIQVDIIRSKGLGGFDWLTKLINDYNDTNYDDINVSLALDGNGHFFYLDDIFTEKDERAINTIDLTGGNANELRIDDTLSSNGFDGDVLIINSNDYNNMTGINLDTVKIDGNLWNYAGYVPSTAMANEVAYNEFHNNFGETILVQEHMNWILT